MCCLHCHLVTKPVRFICCNQLMETYLICIFKWLSIQLRSDGNQAPDIRYCRTLPCMWLLFSSITHSISSRNLISLLVKQRYGYFFEVIDAYFVRWFLASLVLLGGSVSYLWEMPGKGPLKQRPACYCFVVSQVLPLKLHDCSRCFYYVVGCSSCQVRLEWAAKPHSAGGKISREYSSRHGRGKTYLCASMPSFEGHTRTCVCIKLKQQRSGHVVAVGR